jgi:hypothetical protein
MYYAAYRYSVAIRGLFARMEVHVLQDFFNRYLFVLAYMLSQCCLKLYKSGKTRFWLKQRSMST